MKTLLEALRRIQSGEVDRTVGICWHVDFYAGDHAGQVLSNLMQEWPEFSGDPAYPVPSYMLDRTPSQCYWASHGKKWEGEYGAARRRLLDWCINELESRDANHPER